MLLSYNLGETFLPSLIIIIFEVIVGLLLTIVILTLQCHSCIKHVELEISLGGSGIVVLSSVFLFKPWSQDE